jgi:integrase
VDSTRARDESIWACHLEPVFGATPLAKLRRSDVAALVVDLVDNGLGPTTVTRCLAALKKALTDAVAEGLITASPPAGLKPPRPDQIERRFLTLDELNRIEAAMATRWRPVVPFAACTGLRIRELAALRVVDLNPCGPGGQGPSHRGWRYQACLRWRKAAARASPRDYLGRANCLHDYGRGGRATCSAHR